MNTSDAIAAALNDLRYAVAILRKGGAVAVDLGDLRGGHTFLSVDMRPHLSLAYSGAIDRALLRMAGMRRYGLKVSAA